MGFQFTAVTPPPSSAASMPSSSTAIATSSRPAFLGSGCVGLGRTQSSGYWSVGRVTRWRVASGVTRRALRSSLDGIGSDDGEFWKRIEELAIGLRPGAAAAGGCGWPGSVERSASSVGLPLSLRMLKRKKQQEGQGARRRWDKQLLGCSGESVGRAFSSMVLIVRELQSFTLQMREALLYEDLQRVLARVHEEMHASFLWLFQHVFSGTPALMVSVMLLLANFTVHSMGHSVVAAAAPAPPPAFAAVTVVDSQHVEQFRPRFDPTSVKTFSVGRTASVGSGNSGGGGKVRPVAGATDDDRSDESSYRQSRGAQPVAAQVGTGLEEVVSDAMANVDAEDEQAMWEKMVAEASKIQASARAEALTDPGVLGKLVAPVEAELETENYAEYAQTEQRYEQAVSEESNNSLLLANFAQFLFLVLNDHDRAEEYFKKAVRAEPADAEALSRYATFLWKARNDLETAEETYQEAIAADPGNAHHAAAYAHFLWNTGGEDTCYPVE